MTVNYVYLGYGTTDENGECKLDHDANGNPISHSYTGTGAGKVDIVASLDSEIDESSLVSETYELIDAIFYDKAVTGHKNTNWLNVSNSFLETIEDDGTILAYNRTSGWATIYANSNSASTFPFSIGSVVEFDVVSCTNEMRLQFYDGTTGRLQITLPTNATNYHVKIEIGETTITQTVNGVTTTASTSTYINNDFQVNFATNTSGASLKFKNFMVYSI